MFMTLCVVIKTIQTAHCCARFGSVLRDQLHFIMQNTCLTVCKPLILTIILIISCSGQWLLVLH